ncbi:MAG: hypothetical protein ACRD7E_18460 [Bryobacteraceae bacterium]
MTYRVTFRKRFKGDGQESEIQPEHFVRPPDGVVLNALLSEQDDPPAKHSQEILDEDDDFESVGTEIWEYEIADDREDDFIAALENSRVVLQYERIDDVAV